LSKGRDRTVYRRSSDGKWIEKRNDASKGSVHQTQGEAIRAAKEHLENQGGGELTVQGMDGKFRSKDSISPGNDPAPPRDTEH